MRQTNKLVASRDRERVKPASGRRVSPSVLSSRSLRQLVDALKRSGRVLQGQIQSDQSLLKTLLGGLDSSESPRTPSQRLDQFLILLKGCRLQANVRRLPASH